MALHFCCAVASAVPWEEWWTYEGISGKTKFKCQYPQPTQFGSTCPVELLYRNDRKSMYRDVAVVVSNVKLPKPARQVVTFSSQCVSLVDIGIGLTTGATCTRPSWTHPIPDRTNKIASKMLLEAG